MTKISIIEQEIEFKSDTPNYYAELSGNKSNTIRKVDDDNRFDILNEMKEQRRYGKIKIIHKQMPKETFIRKISNITYFQGYCIISWIAKLSIQKVLEEVKKKRFCKSEVAFHVCKDYPEDCEYFIHWEDFEKVFGK